MTMEFWTTVGVLWVLMIVLIGMALTR